jgi:hypothetical protein
VHLDLEEALVAEAVAHALVCPLLVLLAPLHLVQAVVLWEGALVAEAEAEAVVRSLTSLVPWQEWLVKVYSPL